MRATEKMLGVVLFVGLVVFCATIFMSQPVSAANAPDFFVTWKAQTYVPNGYHGKALPTGKSRIFIAFELIDQGAPVDLSRQTIYWYLNDDLIENMPGTQSVIIRAPEIPTESLAVRVTLPNYNGGSISKTIMIPTVSPSAVIESPYPNNKISAEHIVLKGTPYFFNIDATDLTFSWLANGTEAIAKDPSTLEINLSALPTQTTTLPVELTIRNRFASFEVGKSNIDLTLAP